MVPPKPQPYNTLYPHQYIAYRAPNPPVIDGNLDKPFWNEVPWTQDFCDIATDVTPEFRTRVKMRWDEEFLYVGESVGCLVYLFVCVVGLQKSL
jgi:hypothetical protein